MADLKSIKKGDKAIMCLFTGAYADTVTIQMADAKKLGFTDKQGNKRVFDKTTGKQISPAPKSDKYANKLIPYDEEFEKIALEKRFKPNENATHPSAKRRKKVAIHKNEKVEELD